MNYVIEDGLDFMSELNKSLKEDKNEDNICLITRNILDKSHVKLECGHRFNYGSIYNEVKYQKATNFDIIKLGLKQLRCPYCRNIQNTLLPQLTGYNERQGVNAPQKYCMMVNKCKYQMKAKICNKGCMNEYCSVHEKVIKNKNTKEKTYQEKRCDCYTIKGSRCKNTGLIIIEDNKKVCRLHNKKYENLKKKVNEGNNDVKIELDTMLNLLK
tara:strand:- start:5381 stop:6019 length:639 start_codon:yes stop_codon:yes gene_type:complete